jgi:aromatic-L-amino-acid decarboxylase
VTRVPAPAGEEPERRPPDPGAAAATSGGDLPEAVARRALHRAADLAADYLAGSARYPVLPALAPGEAAALFPASPPAAAEPLDAILDDYRALVEPHVTHWNHPGFLAYFAITGSAPGVAAETLTAALNVNAMLWRTSPVATELEERVCDWVRQMVGLPEGWRGHLNDTASISTFLALGAARHAVSERRIPGAAIREHGLAGRPEIPALTVYASDQAHSSVDKALLALGLGTRNLRRVESDERFRLDPRRLAAAIAADRAAGRLPIAVVATAGTTSTTSVDPLPEIAAICREEGLWLHVYAAYAGNAMVCPELRPLLAGWEQADSIVLNPHKWLFVPLDCSLLLVRDLAALRAAYSLVPAYLETSETEVTNLMDLGIQLGKRFRALKLWMVIRAFGVAGIAARIRAQVAMAHELAARIGADPDFEVMAPVPFSVVCLRARFPGLDAEGEDHRNEQLLEAVNAAGPVFLSHTRVRGRVALRIAVGNLRSTRETLAQAWQLVREEAARLRG